MSTTYRYEPVWDPAVPPGGFVCNFCAMPVESDPCEYHAPAVEEPFPCGHEVRTRDCGGCDPGAIDFVIEAGGARRPFDPARDLIQQPANPDPWNQDTGAGGWGGQQPTPGTNEMPF